MDINLNYREAVKSIKEAILRSQYRAAASVNKEQLSLYYGIGYVDGQVAVIVTASHCAAESGSQNGCLQYVLFHDSSHFKCLFPSGIIG